MLQLMRFITNLSRARLAMTFLWCCSMNYARSITRFVLIMMVAFTSKFSHAKAPTIDPAETTKALSILLAESNAPIPKSSSCMGSYGQTGKAAVKHLLAAQLAYLYSGENIIQGKCSSTQCTLAVNHSSGEDLSSTTVTFGVKQGKANISTLHCVITP
jgi:hypothetical protein